MKLEQDQYSTLQEAINASPDNRITGFSVRYYRTKVSVYDFCVDKLHEVEGDAYNCRSMARVIPLVPDILSDGAFYIQRERK